MENRRAEIIWFDVHDDERGRLVTMAEQIPFDIKRVFYIYGNRTQRGGHAHKKCEQVLIAIQGRVDVKVGEDFYSLMTSRYGLYVPPGNRIDMEFGENAILLVLASERYDPDDYIQ